MKLCKWGVAGMLCASLCAGQTPAEKRGHEIINASIAAIGGDKFLNMSDRTESGRAYSFYRERLSGLSIAKIYTRYVTVAKGKSGEELGVREREAFGKNEDTSVLFTETSGWDISWRGSKELPKDRLDRYRETTLRNVFYIFRQRLHEAGMIFESRGSDVFENQPVDIVNITDSQNRLVTVYFHQSTHLPVRQVYVWSNPETKQRDEEETRFSRYREEGGVQWPHEITRKRNGEKVYEIFSDSVTIDRDLTDNLFTVPGPGETTQKAPVKKR
jgi:hypothetical protein